MTFGFGSVGLTGILDALKKRLDAAGYNKKHPIDTMKEKPETKEEKELAKTLFEDYEQTDT